MSGFPPSQYGSFPRPNMPGFMAGNRPPFGMGACSGRSPCRSRQLLTAACSCIRPVQQLLKPAVAAFGLQTSNAPARCVLTSCCCCLQAAQA
jgi:hypothetical protein